MHYEDALKFLVEGLAKQPNEFFENLDSPPDFDVWLPRAVIAFVAETEGKDASLLLLETLRTNEYRPVWIAFYDAASELCRRGIFRASELCPQAVSDHARRRPGDGYSITVAGREWLNNANARYFPTAPGRYVQALQRPATVLGGGFLQRAGEAAGCHSSGNYLACCAMCGAAAEATLLAIATEKTGNRELVLNKYEQSGGREKVTRLIFSPRDRHCLNVASGPALNCSPTGVMKQRTGASPRLKNLRHTMRWVAFCISRVWRGTTGLN